MVSKGYRRIQSDVEWINSSGSFSKNIEMSTSPITVQGTKQNWM